MDRISAAIKGESIIEVFTASPQDFLNRVSRKNIALRQVEYLGANRIRATAEQMDEGMLRNIAETMGAELEVERRRGGSILRGRLRRRASLPLGLLVMTVLLCVSSLFVWDVRVEGCVSMKKSELLRAASECGLYCGASRLSLSNEKIKNELLAQFPQAAWMSININGSRAIIAVKERDEKPLIYDASPAADIVASRDGIIRRVSVLQGKAMVKKSDAAVKGQLLVSSDVRRSFTQDAKVCARATVLADTWREINSVCPLHEQTKTVGRPHLSSLALVFGKNRINLFGNSGKAIDGCDKIIKEYKLGAEGLFAAPLGVIVEKAVPYTLTERELLDTLAQERRLHSMLLSDTQGQIVSESCSVCRAGELVIVTLRAHCLENIGLSVPAQTQP